MYEMLFNSSSKTISDSLLIPFPNTRGTITEVLHIILWLM